MWIHSTVCWESRTIMTTLGFPYYSTWAGILKFGFWSSDNLWYKLIIVNFPPSSPRTSSLSLDPQGWTTSLISHYCDLGVFWVHQEQSKSVEYVGNTFFSTSIKSISEPISTLMEPNLDSDHGFDLPMTAHRRWSGRHVSILSRWQRCLGAREVM